MKTHYKHIHFEQIPLNLEPAIWICQDAADETRLGLVGDRDGVTYFVPNTGPASADFPSLSAGQLRDIADFIEEAEKQRKD